MKIAKLIFILALICLFTKAKASVHAGNITYTWLYGYTYQIKYTIYTTGTPSNNYCDISPGCSQTGAVFLRSNGPAAGPCSPAQEGLILSGSNYTMSEYVGTHSFPGPGNYMFCLEIPNRNAGVINIPNSVNQVMYLESYIVIPTFNSKNNSPVFGNHPIASGCSNNGCFTYNSAATDADGDSLSYEIAPCKGYSAATTPGYVFPDAGAGGTFSINPITGTLSWCSPQINGLYNVVIRIKEWRNDGAGGYSLIGYVERDVELSLSTCTNVKEQAQAENYLSVYPNPVTHRTVIDFPEKENYSVKLFDLTGKLMLNESCENSSTYVLNLENINTGIYFLKITGNHNTIITKKIVKQ